MSEPIRPTFLILLGAVLAIVPAAAQVQAPASVAKDVAVVSGAVGLDGANKTFTRSAADGLVKGMGTQTPDVPGYAVSSASAMGQAGADRLAFCRSADRSRLTDNEKAQCDAATAAAGVATVRGQYGMQPSQENAWARQASASAAARTRLDPTLGGNAPVYTIKGGSCDTVTQQLAAGKTAQTCAVSHRWTAESCTEVLSVKVTTTWAVSLAGAVVAIASSEAEAATVVAANPGATVERKVDSRDVWSADCVGFDASQLCDRDGEACVLGPQTQVINGESVQRACWARTKGYTCYSPTPSADTCAVLVARACVESRRTCALTRTNGDCVDASVDMACPAGSYTATTANCSGDKLCLGDLCFATSGRGDGDFANAMTYLEASREAGVYASASGGQVRLFQGQMGACTKPAGPGIGTNCCTESAGAATNHQAMGDLAATSMVGGTVVSTLLGNAASVGTHYAYDFMFSNDFFSSKAEAAFSFGEWNPNADFTSLLQGPSFSMYGFSFGPVGGGIGGMLPGTMTFGDPISMLGGQYQLTFNPYVFAAMVAINVISQLNSCTADEKMLAMRRGANLCQHFDTYCSRRLPWPLRTCIQETEDWCCWNSKLAMAISTQAKPHSCDGFTPQEFAAIDFSRIDLSAFTSEMQSKAASYQAVATPSAVQALQQRTTSSPTGAVRNLGANPTIR